MARQAARITGQRASVRKLSAGSGLADGRYAESIPYEVSPEEARS